MDEAISILREQTVFCSQLLKMFGELATALQTNSLEMTNIARKIEPVVMQLNRNAVRAQNFLDRMNAKTFSEFLSAQEEGVKRNLATSLLTQSGSLQAKLKNRTETLGRLTKSGDAFVKFSLNVLSRTAQKSTYGAAAETGTQNGRRLFDTNV